MKKNVLIVVAVLIVVGLFVYPSIREKLQRDKFLEIIDTLPSPLQNEAGVTRILTPREGDEIPFSAGNYTITWNTNEASHAGKKVHLYLTQATITPDGRFNLYYIGSADFNAGSYTWTFPRYDPYLGVQFINRLTSVAMTIHDPALVPAAPEPGLLTFFAGQQYKSEPTFPVVYSESFKVLPISVAGSAILFPQTGARFTIGTPLTIRWKLAKDIGTSEIYLSLVPVPDDGTTGAFGGAVTKPSLPQGTTSFTWDAKQVQISVGGGFITPDLKAGTYKIFMDFQTSDGYPQRVESGNFKLVD